MNPTEFGKINETELIKKIDEIKKKYDIGQCHFSHVMGGLCEILIMISSDQSPEISSWDKIDRELYVSTKRAFDLYLKMIDENEEFREEELSREGQFVDDAKRHVYTQAKKYGFK